MLTPLPSSWPYRAARRDLFVIHAAENGGLQGRKCPFRTFVQFFSRQANRPLDLRLRVERKTVIEPGWPVWRAEVRPVDWQ